MIPFLLTATLLAAAASPSPAAAPAPPAATAAPAPAAPKPLTLDALRGIVSVREPQISLDGKRVVYVRGVNDYTEDTERTELVLVDLANGNARRVLTHDREDVSSPTWSPDGTRIAFLAAP